MKIRNKQFDILLGIGIIMVVMGHSHQPPYLFFPPYFFHIALFFSITGYFFEIKEGVQEKWKYLVKKTRTQLVPYFCFSFFFGLLTWALKKYDINLGDPLNFHTLLIRPFIDGHSFYLFSPAWFLLNIYCLNIFAQIVFLKNTKPWRMFWWVLAPIVALFLLQKGLTHYLDWRLFIVRSSFGFLFFSFGMILRFYEEKIQKYLLSNWFLIGNYLAVIYLNTYFGNIKYSIVWGSVENNLVLVPILSTMAILGILYKLSFHIAKAVKDDSLLVRLGRNSFSIMVWHLSVFFLINVGLFAFSVIPKEKLSVVFFQYKLIQSWIWYLIPALLLPLYGSELYRKGRDYFKRKFITNKI